MSNLHSCTDDPSLVLLTKILKYPKQALSSFGINDRADLIYLVRKKPYEKMIADNMSGSYNMDNTTRLDNSSFSYSLPPSYFSFFL